MFRYPFKLPPPVEGVGPIVKVVFDGGPLTEHVQTRFRYWYESEVNYTVTLSGHSSYNITEYHKHWTFVSLTIDGMDALFDESSDINEFIYISGLDPDNVLEVTWRANDLYPVAVWKEDAFKTGWDHHPSYYIRNMTPVITKDGNMVELSWNFTPAEYQFYYYVKPCNLLTSEDEYFIVRWKSTGPVAVVNVYFEGTEQRVVPFNSQSEDWTVTTVRLEPDKQIVYVMVGISNLGKQDISGFQAIYVDYILICRYDPHGGIHQRCVYQVLAQ